MLTVAALVLYAAISAEPVLRISVVTDEKPSIMRRKIRPLTDYLSKQIGMKIEFRPMANADALINALAANKLDMVWFSGFDFIQARVRSNDQVTPIAQRAEDAQTRSVFITARHDITGLNDLKGKTFAFGEKTSTSSYLMPRAFLLSAHIDPDADIKHIIYAGTHDAVVAAVAGGNADAGALDSAAWQKLLAEGKANPIVLHVFYTSPAYCDYNWTARADMDANVRQKLTGAFLALDNNIMPGKEILGLQHTSRFTSANAGNYSDIEAAARSAGSLK